MRDYEFATPKLDPICDMLNDAILAGRIAELECEWTDTMRRAGRYAAADDHINGLRACNAANDIRRQIEALQQQLEGGE